MRILYGVVGEGMGHAIRSRVILDELVKRHDVQVVVSGRAHDYLAKRAGEHLHVKKIWGLTIVTEDNEVRNFKTLLQNVKGAVTGGWPQNVRAYFELTQQFQPEIVISDFESWSYLYGKNHRIPVISVDNMQIINRCKHEPADPRGPRGGVPDRERDHQEQGARRVPLLDQHLLLSPYPEEADHAAPSHLAAGDPRGQAGAGQPLARLSNLYDQQRAAPDPGRERRRMSHLRTAPRLEGGGPRGQPDL